MENVLNETHLLLRINIFDQTHRVLVRKELTVGRLVEEILHEFQQDIDQNRKYVLSLKGKPIENDLPVLEVSLEEDEALVLSYELALVSEPIARPLMVRSEEDMKQTAVGGIPIPTTGGRIPLLQEAETGVEFPLREFPALIGRPKPGDTSRLAVDLGRFKESMTVSRPHARVTYDGQGYAVEAIKSDRPIYVNGQEYLAGQKHTLREGDAIDIGKIRLWFHMK